MIASKTQPIRASRERARRRPRRGLKAQQWGMTEKGEVGEAK